MEEKEYYSISNIISKERICLLEKINEFVESIDKSEALDMFSYIANNINNNDKYEKDFYISSDLKSMGIIIFENNKMKELFSSFYGIGVGLQAYIKIKFCHIQYIIHKSARDEEEHDFIVIHSGISKQVYFTDDKFSIRECKDTKLVIYNDKGVFCESGKRFFPANLKSLCKTNFEIGKIIIEYFSQKHFFWKDILRDYSKGCCFAPISLLLIWDTHSKKELFEIKNRTILMKGINRYSMKSAFLLTKALKHIELSEFQKLASLTEETIVECASLIELFKAYYKSVLINYEEEHNHYLYDYCSMVVRMKKKFNLKIKSVKKLISEHNILAIEYRSKFVKTIKIPKDSVFLKLKLPDKYKLITTKKALIEESVINEHCVSSYDTDINKSRCAIYTTFYNNKRYTIEVRCSKARKKIQFYINQCYGKRNSEAPIELWNELTELMKSESIRIFKN